MLNEKETAEELDESYQKRLQKIVGKFLYYDGAIDTTMLMALNSLAELQTIPTIETSKQITTFLNYSASHPYSVIECRRSRMILHISSDASCISEPEARSRADGFFLNTKSKTPITSMTTEKGSVYV